MEGEPEVGGAELGGPILDLVQPINLLGAQARLLTLPLEEPPVLGADGRGHHREPPLDSDLPALTGPGGGGPVVGDEAEAMGGGLPQEGAAGLVRLDEAGRTHGGREPGPAQGGHRGAEAAPVRVHPHLVPATRELEEQPAIGEGEGLSDAEAPASACALGEVAELFEQPRRLRGPLGLAGDQPVIDVQLDPARQRYRIVSAWKAAPVKRTVWICAGEPAGARATGPSHIT